VSTSTELIDNLTYPSVTFCPGFKNVDNILRAIKEEELGKKARS